MRSLMKFERVARVVATGLLLGAFGVADAADLSRMLAPSVLQAASPHTHPPDGSEGAREHLMGTGPAGMGARQPMNMDADRHYIEWMIPHHDDAIRMAELALAQAEHPEIRTLAAHIGQTQTDEIGQMRQWYQAWYGMDVRADSMAADMMHMSSMTMAPLDGARPFDKAFIEQMIPHHDMAVRGSTMMLQRVENPELRNLLQSIITSQTAEIAQMGNWYQQWYGVSVPQSAGMSGQSRMDSMAPHQMMGSQHMAGMTGQQNTGMDEHDLHAGATTSDRQQIIHEHGSSVMPFDLSLTTHHFQMLPDGGLQTVTVNDPTDHAQIALVQQHLGELVAKVRRGDFSDPAALHGSDMSGLPVLSTAGIQLQIAYSAIPHGGQIRYTTRDPEILEALHEWFRAQLADHGSDATDH
jgi:uncharacterized protein (DUF305 family)